MSVFRKTILISVIVSFLLLIVSGFTLAQRPLEIDYPTIEGARPQNTSFSLPEYVKYLFNFSLASAGLVIFIILIYAGVRRLTSAGNPAAQKEAKDRILAAILGLFVLLFSYLILTTINPELVFLSIPERVVFDPESIIGQETEEKSLAYTEIPVGGLIGELFESGRLAVIKDLAEKTKKQSEEVKKLSDEIDSLTSQCLCSITSPECSGACGGGYCTGDPCPTKAEINQKREELKIAISKEKEGEGLEYWRQKLTLEVDGYLKEDGKKFIGFREIYENLKKAENMIKECPFSASKNGKTQDLLGYSGFLEYRNYLKDFHDVEKDEPEYPFDYIVSGHLYYLASFYCTEVFYQISPISIDEEYLKQAGGEISPLMGSKETVCDQEISIGETIDNAEELARTMLVELDNINSNALNGEQDAQTLISITDPENCVVGNCQTDCIWVEQWCSEPCLEEGEEGDGGGGGGEATPPEAPPSLPPPYWPDWLPWPSSLIKLPVVYAEDCGYDCSYCEILPCSGNVCPGDPANKPQITGQVGKIRESSLQIASSYEKVKNFIEGKNIEDKFKISKIFANLSTAQNKLSACYNSKETQSKLETGQGKVIWQSLYSCTEFKQSLQWQIFYSENYQPINECYGSGREGPDASDNFFCCKEEISPQ
ncbi:MAG: hypothetical protein UV65_C0025G0003 [Parcubacteria group bacterium GW2011_GWF2_43_11]|nr:MAG: hypothetical protein UV65_C0025G0003 [Parcubacteria group bacterium GW2011_GWF2_43_11]